MSSSTTGTTTTPLVSTMLCAKCGGAIHAPSDFVGRRCSCTRPPHKDGTSHVAPLTDAQASAVGHKFCCVCGADVTHAKRMKDHTGRYWCYECGAADQMKKGQALSLRCPSCERNFPVAKMVKINTDYICQECVEKGKTKVKHKPARNGSASSSAPAHKAQHETHAPGGAMDYSQLIGFAVSFIATIVAGGAILFGLRYLEYM